jgi:hypothetical protein
MHTHFPLSFSLTSLLILTITCPQTHTDQTHFDFHLLHSFLLHTSMAAWQNCPNIRFQHTLPFRSLLTHESRKGCNGQFTPYIHCRGKALFLLPVPRGKLILRWLVLIAFRLASCWPSRVDRQRVCKVLRRVMPGGGGGRLRRNIHSVTLVPLQYNRQ